MRIVFMGTPDFAVPSLQALLSQGYEIAAVVTQPDRPKGRKRIPAPPPVKEEALRRGLPVLQPEKLRAPEAVEALRSLRPDLIVTAAYGQIVPKAILDLPRHGCINVHGSLLPKYRGGAPIHRAVMNGEKETGVTIMYMAEGLDTGDMLTSVKVPIGLDDTAGSLFDKLSAAGAELLVRTLPDLLAGRLQGVPQDAEQATYARNLTRDDERIDWRRSARQIYDQIRGLHPWPVAFTQWQGDVFKIWRAEYPGDAGAGDAEGDRQLAAGTAAGPEPGTIVGWSDDGLDVQTGDGTLRVTEVQPAGKRPMPARDFLKGAKLSVGVRLGS